MGKSLGRQMDFRRRHPGLKGFVPRRCLRLSSLPSREPNSATVYCELLRSCPCLLGDSPVAVTGAEVAVLAAPRFRALCTEWR